MGLASGPSSVAMLEHRWAVSKERGWEQRTGWGLVLQMEGPKGHRWARYWERQWGLLKAADSDGY
jgi:hypothetical protein